ncbi:hypothetical protein QA601_07850 [Chitinispirillales bacterium ANBcel5]|uniref:hypothetical protein n=1 Tax=Cellulosispirillum alkaliphilum TaxID=3039283 RepID=UPI002A5664F1|nr:hypothetical protein [Chitinispirillales bacterium ANBcel5]
MIEKIIPEPVQDLKNIFKDELSEVSFPDVSSDVLDELTQEVENKAHELEKIKELLAAAHEALEMANQDLITKASRGLAYAKVYAEGNDELMEKLNSIKLTRAQKAVKKSSSDSDGKRKRKRKTTSTQETPSENDVENKEPQTPENA